MQKRLQIMTNMFITRDRLATLTQRINNSQVLKIDSRNKFQNNRDLNFKLRSKSTKQRNRRDDTTSNRSDQRDNSINESRNNEIVKLLLRKADEQSNDFKNEKICYNCDEKKHITSKCFNFKQKNFRINVIKIF